MTTHPRSRYRHQIVLDLANAILGENQRRIGELLAELDRRLG